MSRLNSCDPFLKQIVSKQKVASVRLALPVQSLWKFAPVCFSGFYTELWCENVKMLVISPFW